jgi:RNA polymerase sigma factor (sigma-70 family)
MTATAPARITIPDDEVLREAMSVAKRIACNMARKYVNCDAEELTSVSYLAVVEALVSHDASRGPWKPRIIFTVKGRINDYFRKLDPLTRLQRRRSEPGQATTLSLDSLMQQVGFLPGICDEEFKQVENRLLAKHYLGLVCPRYRRVVAAYYFGEINLREIGELMGIRESRVCQLLTKSLKRMRLEATAQ